MTSHIPFSQQLIFLYPMEQHPTPPPPKPCNPVKQVGHTVILTLEEFPSAKFSQKNVFGVLVATEMKKEKERGGCGR